MADPTARYGRAEVAWHDNVLGPGIPVATVVHSPRLSTANLASTRLAGCSVEVELVRLAYVLQFHRSMKDQQSPDTDRPALQRAPDEWKTGDEPMTDAQRSYLETLCRETGEEFDETLSKADASKRIDELRGRSPRLAQE
jgi:hypothetical protein